MGCGTVVVARSKQNDRSRKSLELIEVDGTSGQDGIPTLVSWQCGVHKAQKHSPFLSLSNTILSRYLTCEGVFARQ